MRAPPGLVFGPVPSRRLGRSLGINNIAGKTCSYACVYCQVGRTTCLTATRRVFHAPSLVEGAVACRLDRSRATGERVDYLTFVPSGEATLDANLGRTIGRLKRFGLRIAVVTNASLLWRSDVRDDLAEADWVSVKVDTAREATWTGLNRPHGRLSLERQLAGAREFAHHYRGTLTTETMLVAGLNDSDAEVAAAARYIGTLRPATAYIAVPLRPPAEPWVRAPDDHVLVRAYEVLSRHAQVVRFLTQDEDGAWQGEEDVEAALLAIATIHPMTDRSVEHLLESAHADWAMVERLVRDGRLERIRHRDRDFYRGRRA